MMFLRPDSGYADAGGSSSRSGPGPGRFCGCFYVLLLAWRVDPSVDISWILEAPSPYDRSGIVSRYGPTVSVYVRGWCSVELCVASRVTPTFGLERSPNQISVLISKRFNRTIDLQNLPVDCTRHGRRSLCCAVPCGAAAAPRWSIHKSRSLSLAPAANRAGEFSVASRSQTQSESWPTSTAGSAVLPLRAPRDRA